MTLKLLSDAYTGPDGKAYAIGRLYSLPVLGIGLAYPIIDLIQGRHYTLLELGGYFVTLGGAVWIFIKGNNSVDEDPAKLIAAAVSAGAPPHA